MFGCCVQPPTCGIVGLHGWVAGERGGGGRWHARGRQQAAAPRAHVHHAVLERTTRWSVMNEVVQSTTEADANSATQDPGQDPVACPQHSPLFIVILGG